MRQGFTLALAIAGCNGISSHPGHDVGVASYYIAPTGDDTTGDGTAARPWHTIGHADTHLALGAAGTVVHVAPGTYSEGPYYMSRSGTAAARISWQCDMALACLLTRELLLGGESSAANYIDVIGFDITTGHATDPTGLAIGQPMLGGGNYSRIVNNRIHDIGDGDCDHPANVVLDEYTHDVTFDGNIINGGGVGGGCTDSTSTTNAGIYVVGYHNTITNNQISNMAGPGVQLYANACQNVVSNNTIFHNWTVGLSLGGSEGRPTGSPCEPLGDDYNAVHNNLIVHNGYGLDGGVNPRGCDAIEVFSPGSGSDNYFFNNLLAGNFACDGTQANNSINVSTATISQSGTIAQNGADVSNLFVNYLDDGTGDYHLVRGSPAIDAGTDGSTCAPAPGITPCVPPIDLGGVTRPQGTGFDIGAYESH